MKLEPLTDAEEILVMKGELMECEENIERCNLTQNNHRNEFIEGKTPENLYYYNANVYEKDEEQRHLIPFSEVGKRLILNFEFSGMIYCDKEHLAKLEQVFKEWDQTPVEKLNDKVKDVHALLDKSEGHLIFVWL